MEPDRVGPTILERFPELDGRARSLASEVAGVPSLATDADTVIHHGLVPFVVELIGKPRSDAEQALLQRIFDFVESLAADPSPGVQAYADTSFVEALRSAPAAAAYARKHLMGPETRYCMDFQTARSAQFDHPILWRVPISVLIWLRRISGAANRPEAPRSGEE